MFLGIAHFAHNAHPLRQLVMRRVHGISQAFGPGATLAGDAGRRRWQVTLAGVWSLPIVPIGHAARSRQARTPATNMLAC